MFFSLHVSDVFVIEIVFWNPTPAQRIAWVFEGSFQTIFLNTELSCVVW
jgi:hypothetical protein